MTLKSAFAEVKKDLKKDESLDINMVESFIESIESVERFIRDKFARRQITLLNTREEIDEVKDNFAKDYTIEFDTGYDFYCEIVETEDYFSGKRKLYLFLLDLDQLR